MGCDTSTSPSQINESCVCQSLDRQALQGQLATMLQAGLLEALPETHPHLFSDTPIYVSKADMAAMQEVVGAVEALTRRPEYRIAIGIENSVVATRDWGQRGAFMGYDFHLTDAGPKLIEINTNAGGAFLNSVACEAQRACCPVLAELGTIACPTDLSMRIAEMFRSEWRLQRGSAAPGLIAIVDDDPQNQYLYPEFVLAQALLSAQGLPSVIADAAALIHRDGKLWFGEQIVDLVYNRLVDFDLSEPRHAALRAAYSAGHVVMTPGPHHHALFADKRNLVTLTNATSWAVMPLSDVERHGLAHIPPTRLVTRDNADQLWTERNGLFFKPVCGHGGKGVYRGDKLTRKTWAAILDAGYVAQQTVPPGSRLVATAAGNVRQKVDVRLFTYGGEMLLAAARIYQGQTTNFRTPGGGFAPVMVMA